MNIRDERTDGEGVQFRSMNSGAVFECNGTIYQKIRHDVSPPHYYALKLANGIAFAMGDACECQLLNAELVIEDGPVDA